MPTRGGSRRRAKRIPATITTYIASMPAVSTPSAPTIRERTVSRKYEFWLVSGGSVRLDYGFEQSQRWSVQGTAYQRMMAGSGLIVHAAPVTCEGATRTVYFITSADDLTSKVDDFRAWFTSLRPRSSDWTHFPTKFAPDKYFMGRSAAEEIDQDIWWSLNDGIAWTLDRKTAELAVLAFEYATCSMCGSQNIKMTYDAGDALGHDLLTINCSNCQYSETI